jgi:hypothetical protein
MVPADADRACLRCHDGRSASAEAHPIGRPVSKDRTLPAGWPLAGGRLSCLTCHDVKNACIPHAARSDENANLLRGDARVPRGTAGGEFCGHCHAPAESPKFNPHVMLTADRQAVTERCLACHSALPDSNAGARSGQPLLRASEIRICRSCHLRHKEQFNPGHLGAKVKPDMLAFIRAREVVGLAGPPGPELVAQLKAAGAKPTLMPLSADATITCTTCHNPHQAGVFPPGTPLAYRPMRVTGGHAVSPVHGDQWCSLCHDL